MNRMIASLIKQRLARNNIVEIRVSGTSMNPVLRDGDTINLYAKDEYCTGDIIVFSYNNFAGFLVHRVLLIQDEYYYCKGDNAFRLEKIQKSDIIGAVHIENDKNNSEEFVHSSLLLYKLFARLHFDKQRIVRTEQYQDYYQKYLKPSNR